MGWGTWGRQAGPGMGNLGEGPWGGKAGSGEGSWSRQAGPGAGRWTMGWSGGPWGGQVGPGGSLSAASSARGGFVGNDSGISLRTRPATEGRK